MTTTKQLIEYLKTLPEDTEVKVIITTNNYLALEVDLDLSDDGNTFFEDMTGRFTSEHGLYNKKFLTLGVE